jgi:hypothetical protein
VTAGRYRKRPVEVDAIRYDGNPESVFAWGRSLDVDEDAMYYFDGKFIIPTLEGAMRVDPGDWVIRGIAGEFYPCKPEIFAATYEAAS